MSAHVRAALAVAAILIVALVALVLSGAPRVESAVDFTHLPDAIMGLRAEEIRHCHNEQCLGSFLEHELGTNPACPRCESPLYADSLAEKRSLPPDTVVMKRQYRSDDGQSYFVAVVLSGKERRSIHKAQTCLVGQGHRISRQRVVSVATTDGTPLDAMVLNLDRPQPNGQVQRSQYIYWFTDGTRQTPRHLERLFWIAWDGVVHNLRRRWAYVAVAVARPDGEDGFGEASGTFIGDLHAALSRSLSD